MNNKIKIGLIGCGRISKNHLKAISHFPEDLELVAICDNQDIRINEFLYAFDSINNSHKREKNLLSIYKNYSDLILAVEKKVLNLDLIVLTTPSGIHSAQAISAANVGLHVCTEKPMATKWLDGLKMFNACKKAGVKLFVVKQNRFNTTLQLLKRQIEKGRFGKISLITSNVFWQRPQDYYDQDEWRGTLEFDGGALMNQASHYVDLLTWLNGSVINVNAFTATISRKIEVEDTAALNLVWENGAIGSMAVTMLTFPKNLEGSITFLGEKGTVKIGGKAVNKIEIWEFDDKDSDDLLVEKANYEIGSVYGFGHPAFYNNMINVLKGIEEPICDGREGLKSLELIEAAYRSAETSSNIILPLKLNE